MARIRTIKPEFWTDEKIVQLPYEVRLLFIGMWNFCDDYGFIWDEPDRIKMQVLPADNVNVQGAIDLLCAAGLLEIYVSESGDRSFKVAKFSDHQKVDRPTESKIARETTRKLAITTAMRRAIAIKYGCAPGESKTCECFYCGSPGEIIWHKKRDGLPSTWVQFRGFEIDHLEPESKQGVTAGENFVLACRDCNRSKGSKDFISFVGLTREDSRGLAPEGKGKEEEGKGFETPPTPSRMTLSGVRTAFRESIGVELGGGVNQALSEICQTYTPEAINDAMLRTSTRVPRPTNPFMHFKGTLEGRARERSSPENSSQSAAPADSFSYPSPERAAKILKHLEAQKAKQEAEDAMYAARS